MVRNVGGGRPGEVDRAAHGQPGKIGFCFAEDEEGSPWTPLSTDFGAVPGTNTVVLFTSDNGPFLSYGDHAGSAGPLRGGKLTTFEGGVRMPAMLRWPGHVPAGSVTDEDARKQYPQGWNAPKPYMRIVPQPRG